MRQLSITILQIALLSGVVSAQEVSPQIPSPLSLWPVLVLLLTIGFFLCVYVLLRSGKKLRRELAQQTNTLEEVREEQQRLQSHISHVKRVLGLEFWELSSKDHALEKNLGEVHFSQLHTNEKSLFLNDQMKISSPELAEKFHSDLIRSIKEQTWGTVSGVIPHSNAKGNYYIELHWMNHYAPSGKHTHTEGFLVNLTQQKRHEEKIRETEIQLRSIINSINALIYLKDKNGVFLYANQPFANLHNMPVAALMGKTAYDLFSSSDAKKNTQRDSSVIENGEKITYDESSAKRHKRTVYSTTKVPLFDREGAITGLVAMSVDITEQQKLERELIKARDEAEFAFRSKSEFLANMSHEIRTPLNAVTGFSELLQDIVEDEQQKKYLTAIKTAGKTLLGIINDILDLSKLEAGKVKLNIEAVSLKSVYSDLEELFKMKAQEKGLQLTFFISNTIPTCIDIDPERVKQLLLNLIGNALKFTESGSITVSAETASDEKKLILSVKDTGIGIKSSAIETIFQNFQQQSGQDSRKYGGTGLGLSICKRIVTLMKGNIYVSSREGAGASFTITLPLITSADQTALVQRSEIKPEVLFNRESVWIAEDSESNRTLLEEAMAMVNVKTRSFSSPRKLLKALEKDTPSIILTDFHMPDMNGIELLQRCREIEKCKNIPIIVLTTLDNIQEFQFFQGKGFDHCLQKPIEIEKLYNILTTYLNGNRANRSPISNAADMLPEERQSEPVPQELISYLETTFLTQIQALQGAVKLAEIKEITAALEEQPQVKNTPQITDFIAHIYSAVKQFDVMSIKALPQKTQELIRQCKESIS